MFILNVWRLSFSISLCLLAKTPGPQVIILNFVAFVITSVRTPFHKSEKCSMFLASNVFLLYSLLSAFFPYHTVVVVSSISLYSFLEGLFYFFL